MANVGDKGGNKRFFTGHGESGMMDGSYCRTENALGGAVCCFKNVKCKCKVLGLNGGFKN